MHKLNGLLATALTLAVMAPEAGTRTSSILESIARQIPGRDLRVDPPSVQSLTILPMGREGEREKGILKVRFKESGLPTSLRFLYQGQVKVLHDDGLAEDEAGDGLYSASVTFDLGELLEHQVRMKESGDAATLPNLAAIARNELPVAPLTTGSGLNPEKTLLIRDLSVVNNAARTSDPCLSVDKADSARKWTFGYAMTQIANQAVTKRTPSEVALSLLRQWETATTVNGEVIEARPGMRELILDKWMMASGNTGRLAMHKAPFRLLAIVNRIDLRHNLFFGEGLAGEFHLVWGALDLEFRAADGTCLEIPDFTLIMEFAVDRSSPEAVKAWGQKWVDLNGMVINSNPFRDSLQSLTESVVRAGVGTGMGRANGSALIRIRTNEIALASALGWEFREFVLAKGPRADSGLFIPATVKQTPAVVHNGSVLFADYVNAKESEILSGKHNVPVLYKGRNFLGGRAKNTLDFWNAPRIRNPEARFLVSLNACNGCHGGETATEFQHVAPRPRSSMSGLSGFLTGGDVTDPVDGVTVRHFNELRRRAADLESLTASPGLSQMAFVPLGRTH